MLGIECNAPHLTIAAAEYSWVNPIQVWAPGTIDLAKGEVRFKAYAV